MSIYGGDGLDTALSVFGGGDPLSMGVGLLKGVGGMGLFGGGSKSEASSLSVRDTLSGVGGYVVRNDGSTVNNDSRAAIYNKPLIDFGDPKEVLGLVITLLVVSYIYKKFKG